jgi:hypothetical protein
MLKMLILFKTVFVMSVGNKKNSGNKGNNFPWQYKVLLGLQGIADNTDLVESLLQQIENNTDGVEGLLGQILTAVQSDKDFEASFAKDANDVVWLEVRTLDLDTNIWSIAYHLPGDLTAHQLQPGDPAGPLGPLTYESPASLLALILAEMVAHTALLTDMDNNTDNVETLLTNLGLCCDAGNLLLQSIAAEDFATETTLATILTSADFQARINTLGQKTMANSTPVVLASDQSAIPVTFPTGVQSSRYVRTVGVTPVNILTGSTEVTIMNTGSDDITVDTGLGAEVLDPGVTISFRAREGKTLGAYVVTGSSAASKFVYTAVI